MKKLSFEKGAFIATFCIFLSKILGLLYVIPFYAIIGEQAGVLYSYAYMIYTIFLSISTAGIPVAISKLTSEYETLNMKEAKSRMFSISIRFINYLSVFIFFVLMVFAPVIAKFIIGDATGGNSVSDVALVIRSISFAILTVPYLSVARGYLQGHRYISVTSWSQVIEQLVRVLVVIVGSYVVIYLLKLSEVTAITVSVFGAFVGALGSRFYIAHFLKKDKDNLFVTTDKKDDVSNKEIIKKIIGYALPYIVISLLYSVYTFIDVIIINRVLYNIVGYSQAVVETIISTYSTWGEKLQMIITSIACGIAISLIPNIVRHFVANEKEKLNNTFNKAIEIVLYTGIPLAILISIFSSTVWNVFYGQSHYGPLTMKVFIFVAIFASLENVCSSSLQAMNKFKILYKSVFIGIIINAVLDAPMMILFYKLGIYPVYGAMVASMLGFGAISVITFWSLKRDCGMSFKSIYKTFLKLLIPFAVMILVALGLKYFIADDCSSRLMSIVYAIIYFGVCLLVYFGITIKQGVFFDVLNDILPSRFKRRVK